MINTRLCVSFNETPFAEHLFLILVLVHGESALYNNVDSHAILKNLNFFWIGPKHP